MFWNFSWRRFFIFIFFGGGFPLPHTVLGIMKCPKSSWWVEGWGGVGWLKQMINLTLNSVELNWVKIWLKEFRIWRHNYIIILWWSKCNNFKLFKGSAIFLSIVQNLWHFYKINIFIYAPFLIENVCKGISVLWILKKNANETQATHNFLFHFISYVGELLKSVQCYHKNGNNVNHGQ